MCDFRIWWHIRVNGGRKIMAEPEVTCIWKGPNELGESPNWNCLENALY